MEATYPTHPRYPQSQQYASYTSNAYPSPPPSIASSPSSPLLTPVYYCLHPTCANVPGFKRHADLQRHTDGIHNRDSVELVDCTYPGCHRTGKYGFFRKDKMVAHLREVHKVDVPKRVNGRMESA